MTDYEHHDGLGLADLVARGVATPIELLDAAIVRVERSHPELNAVVDRMYDIAKAAIEAGLPAGPFRGVPYLLKDLGAPFAGTVTTAGSMACRNFTAGRDSEMVVRLKRAGLVIFGKTHSPEFGLTTTSESRLFGVTHNPWRRGFSAGGSSGGAAAAVAAGILPMAHATDGGGSIRIPASCCGLFGLKPTRGRVTSAPDFGERWAGMATGHAVTRSVRDSAALLDATAGHDPGDPYRAPPVERPYLDEVGRAPGALRIAFATRAWNGHAVDPECADAVLSAARLCEALGHRVTEATPALDEHSRSDAAAIIVLAQTRLTVLRIQAALGRVLAADELEPRTLEMCERGASVSGVDYAAAVDAIHASGREIARFFADHDVLLTPTMCTPPHRHGAVSLSRPDTEGYLDCLYGDIAFTAPFNATGSPAMSVPLAWSAAGLPVGVQFVGRFGDEATLFRLAAQLEAAQPWAHLRPQPFVDMTRAAKRGNAQAEP